MSFLTKTARLIPQAQHRYHLTSKPNLRFLSQTTPAMSTLNSENISKITDAEKEITNQDQPVKGGPTAQAQSHAGQTINR